jgi:hypothetical protein
MIMTLKKKKEDADAMKEARKLKSKVYKLWTPILDIWFGVNRRKSQSMEVL